MQCVVLAGGLATRMLPLTTKVPKVLLEIEGKPFLHYALKLMAAQGVTEVVLALGHLGEQVEEYLAANPPPVAVKTVKEREPLGTAGALRFCLDEGVLAERFLLTWGDSFLPIDWQQVWADFDGPALMTVLENQGQWDTSNVVFKDGRLVLYDKSRTGAPANDFTHVDYGLLGLERRLVEGLPQRGDVAELFRTLSWDGQLEGHLVRTRFYEIGSKQGLVDFGEYLRAKVLVVLDRDGVLNATIDRETEKDDSPLNAAEVALLPGVSAAVSQLLEHGVELAIASNQPAAAKGKTSRPELEAAHAKVLELSGFRGTSHICWHRKEEGCACRKPKPFLLEEALSAHDGCAAEHGWMVGDRTTDFEAGRAAGLRTALVGKAAGAPDWRGPDLAAFARFLSALKGW